MSKIGPDAGGADTGERGNMRTLVTAAVAAATLLSTLPASAQESSGNAHTSDSDFHLGIGAGLSLLSPIIISGSTLFAGPFGGGSLVIPLDIAGVVRVEPEVSVFHFNRGDEDNSESATTAKVGAGVFYMFGIGDDAQGTVGARFGPQFVSSSQTSPSGPMGETVETSRSAINFAAGPALGGEYFPSEYFSIGAEAQLNFLYLGEEDVEVDPGPDPGGNDQTGFATHTNALIYARAFFL
jgi:hypothetical protein